MGPADRHPQASVTPLLTKREDKQKAPAPFEGETDEFGTSSVTEHSDSDFQPDEQAMLATAIRLSLQTAEQTNEAGPSNTFGYSTPEDLDDLSDASSDNYPLQSRTKMVVTSQAKKKVAPTSADGKVDILYPDFMAAQKRKRTAILSARRANKKEERALMRKLRRKLTHV